MAIVCKRTVFAVVALAVLTMHCAAAANAQSIFRIRFDTVTAKAGDTITVDARYTFTTSAASNLNGYALHLLYDTNELHFLGYVIKGTATEGLSVTDTNTGIAALADPGNFIDTTNPILFGIRFEVDTRLADTAFIVWNQNVIMFDPSEGVDSVVYQNGWVRTPSVAGHVALRTPGDTVKGFTDGYSPDSVRFPVPFIASNIVSAGMTSAWLTFTYDTTILSLASVKPNASEPLVLGSVQQTVLGGGFNEVQIELSSAAGVIQGSDTLVTLNFAGLVGLDTVSTALSNVSLRPVNANALIGTTDYSFDSIYLEGTLPMNVVENRSSEGSIEIFPNPASTEVTIGFGGNGDDAMLGIYNEIGRRVWEGPITNGVWRIPSAVQPGVYHLMIRETSGERDYSGDFIVAPR